VIAWLLAFLATCAIEASIVWRLGPPKRWRVPIALAAQVATHPFVWIAMATLPGPQLTTLACVELWATLVETAVYNRFLSMRGRDAFALSALANAASLLAVSALALLF
jgi:hypothetical protein